MTDIVARLVRFAGKVCLSTDTEIEAAATIDKLRDGMRDIIQERDVLSGENWELRAENEKLREALNWFLNGAVPLGGLTRYEYEFVVEARKRAAALKETGDE